MGVFGLLRVLRVLVSNSLSSFLETRGEKLNNTSYSSSYSHRKESFNNPLFGFCYFSSFQESIEFLDIFQVKKRKKILNYTVSIYKLLMNSQELKVLHYSYPNYREK